MNSAFFDKRDDKFSTDSTDRPTKECRGLVMWRDGGKFAMVLETDGQWCSICQQPKHIYKYHG